MSHWRSVDCLCCNPDVGCESISDPTTDDCKLYYNVGISVPAIDCKTGFSGLCCTNPTLEFTDTILLVNQSPDCSNPLYCCVWSAATTGGNGTDSGSNVQAIGSSVWYRRPYSVGQTDACNDIDLATNTPDLNNWDTNSGVYFEGIVAPPWDGDCIVRTSAECPTDGWATYEYDNTVGSCACPSSSNGEIWYHAYRASIRVIWTAYISEVATDKWKLEIKLRTGVVQVKNQRTSCTTLNWGTDDYTGETTSCSALNTVGSEDTFNNSVFNMPESGGTQAIGWSWEWDQDTTACNDGLHSATSAGAVLVDSPTTYITAGGADCPSFSYYDYCDLSTPFTPSWSITSAG